MAPAGGSLGLGGALLWPPGPLCGGHWCRLKKTGPPHSRDSMDLVAPVSPEQNITQTLPRIAPSHDIGPTDPLGRVFSLRNIQAFPGFPPVVDFLPAPARRPLATNVLPSLPCLALPRVCPPPPLGNPTEPPRSTARRSGLSCSVCSALAGVDTKESATTGRGRRDRGTSNMPRFFLVRKAVRILLRFCIYVHAVSLLLSLPSFTHTHTLPAYGLGNHNHTSHAGSVRGVLCVLCNPFISPSDPPGPATCRLAVASLVRPGAPPRRSAVT